MAATLSYLASKEAKRRVKLRKKRSYAYTVPLFFIPLTAIGGVGWAENEGSSFIKFTNLPLFGLNLLLFFIKYYFSFFSQLKYSTFH